MCKALGRRATLLGDILSDAADGALVLPGSPDDPGLAESYILSLVAPHVTLNALYPGPGSASCLC